jgi:phage protein D
MEPSFSSGPPVLQVRILNQLHRLRRKRYDGQWHDKKDSEIAEEIGKARDKELNNQPRFPWPIRTDANAKAAEKPIFYVGQKNEFDIDFLWKRAHLNGYVVQAEPIPGETDKQRIYFGPSLDPAAQVTYLLEWGKSLIDFKPTLTTANQFKSVTVRGWDRKAQKAIEEKVDFTDPKLKTLNKNLHHMIEQCDPREEFVVEKPVYTRDEARNLARSLLLEQHKHMVKATGTTVGLPKLRAGSKVVIGGVGSRLSGTYFVTSTTHTIGSNGYTTRFEARREDTQSGVMA